MREINSLSIVDKMRLMQNHGKLVLSGQDEKCFGHLYIIDSPEYKGLLEAVHKPFEKAHEIEPETIIFKVPSYNDLDKYIKYVSINNISKF